MIFGQDKRKFQRIEKKFNIDAILIDPQNRESQFTLDPVWTKDVGGDGLGLITKVHCAVGARLNLHLQIPNYEKVIEARGRVVWSKIDDEGQKQYRIGVAFESIEDTDRIAIMKYVATEAKKQSSGGS